MKKRTRILILGIAMMFIMAMSGCGVNHKSPEGVVEALIKNYVSGSEKKVKQCYSQEKDTNELLQNEIDATLKYFAAHNPTKVKVEQCDILSENGDYTYVYIIYNLVLENDQEYPCVGTYMTEKKDGKYYVMSPSEITDDLRNQAADDYAKFMTADSYKTYTKAYNVFLSHRGVLHRGKELGNEKNHCNGTEEYYIRTILLDYAELVCCACG